MVICVYLVKNKHRSNLTYVYSISFLFHNISWLHNVKTIKKMKEQLHTGTYIKQQQELMEKHKMFWKRGDKWLFHVICLDNIIEGNSYQQ